MPIRLTISWIFLVFLVPVTTGQVQFQAITDARQVLENGVFNVQFKLDNARGDEMEYPDFGEFEVISGPSTETSIQIVNGRRTSSLIYRFTLMAPGKEGKYTIGPATIKVQRKVMRTSPIEIEVVKGKPGGSVQGTVMPTDDQVFVRAEIDTGAVYPGQQVRISYRLYAAVGIRNFKILKEDDYADFHYNYVKDFNEVVYTEVIDGVQYRVRTLKSVALFPKKTGTYEIDPFIINIGIGVRSERRSFFFNTRTIPKTIKTEPFNIEVRPLPEGAPENFSGAVGKYALAAAGSPSQLTTDEALVLNVQFAGDGDSKRWSVPTLEHLADDFEVYEPRIKSNRSVDEGGRVINRREVEYLLVPKRAGLHTITVDFTYLNPDSMKYITLKSQPIRARVSQGTGVKGIDTEISPESAGLTLNELASPTRLGRALPVFIYGPTFYALCILPFFFIAWVHWDQKRKDDYAGLDPAERRRLEARNKALKHLEHAKGLLTSDDKSYYTAVSDALFAYISGKLKIPVSELTKQNIEEKMVHLEIPEELRQKVNQMIMKCEMVLYAGGSGQDARQEAYDTTLGIITDIEDI